MSRCVYVTYHPTGYYYIGKCKYEEHVTSGIYVGSGMRFKHFVCAMANVKAETFKRMRQEFAAFAKAHGWVTEILATNETESQNLQLEIKLIRFASDDPYCLN